MTAVANFTIRHDSAHFRRRIRHFAFTQFGEILVCCEFEFGVFLFVTLLNYDCTSMSKTIIDVKHFEFRWSRITRNCCEVKIVVVSAWLMLVTEAVGTLRIEIFSSRVDLLDVWISKIASAVFSVKTEKNANLSYYCFAVFNGLTFVRMHGIAATKRNKIPKNFAVI